MAIAGLRPAVYAAEAAASSAALLRFRHFLRHAYAVALDPAKLEANVSRLSRAVAATDPCIQALLAAITPA